MTTLIDQEIVPIVSDGATGADGNGIASIAYTYATSQTPTGTKSAYSESMFTLSATNKYGWQKEVISYTDGSAPKETEAIIAVYGDKGDTGDPGQLLGLNADTGVILFTSRGALVTEEIKLTIVSANIPIANVTISRSDAGALTKIDDYHYTLDCSTVMTDTITVEAIATYLNKSYSSVVSVTKYVDPSSTPHNFGGVTVVPNLLPDGGWLATGDYFLWAASNISAGSTAAPVVAYPDLVKGEIYEFDGTEWVESTNGNLVMTIS